MKCTDYHGIIEKFGGSRPPPFWEGGGLWVYKKMKQLFRKDYFISLGAGANQIPLIQAARKLGFQVIGVDRDLGAPGVELCDLTIQESITNFRKIKFQLDLLMLDAQIAGIFSASYGAALLTWSYLAEQLGCIGPSRSLMERLLDKYETRLMLKPLEDEDELFAQPPFQSVPKRIHKAEVDAMGFPLIVKTRTGHGKRHIYEIPDYQKLKEMFAKQNLQELDIDPKDLIIEKKIEGDEITVVGLVQNFQFHLISITDKITSSKAPFIELKHQYPSVCQGHREEIAKMHQKIVDIMQIPDAPIVSEWKLRNGKYYLIEMAPQIPGEYLGSFLIPSALKYPFFRNVVRLMVDRKIDPPPSDKKAKSGTIQFYTAAMPENEWRRIEKTSPFFKLLNPRPRHPAQSNHDRFAVAGRLE